MDIQANKLSRGYPGLILYRNELMSNPAKQAEKQKKSPHAQPNKPKKQMLTISLSYPTAKKKRPD